MPETLDQPRLICDAGCWRVSVPYDDAEKWHARLEKEGWPSTLCLDPVSRAASLELRPDADLDRVTAALGLPPSTGVKA